MLRWWIVTQRLVHAAMRAATPPPQRTKDALDAARGRLGLHHSIDLIASPTCEAPAVVRVLRPMIILPADGCSSLDDDELESLLCHECAHVARRDNLLGVFEAVICSVFWFNPWSGSPTAGSPPPARRHATSAWRTPRCPLKRTSARSRKSAAPSSRRECPRCRAWPAHT